MAWCGGGTFLTVGWGGVLGGRGLLDLLLVRLRGVLGGSDLVIVTELMRR